MTRDEYNALRRMRVEAKQRDVIAAIRVYGGDITYDQMRRVRGWHHNVKLLCKRGLIARIGPGRFALCEGITG